MGRKVRVALGLAWYQGPDKNTAANQLVFSHYLGRLQERLYWMSALFAKPYAELQTLRLPPLDPVNTTGASEVSRELDGIEFEFGICEEVGCSLPGLARERCVDSALSGGYDYILFYDDDMLFGTDAFLRLYLDQKDVVAALAFTGREPTMPVIYRFDKGWSEEFNCPAFNTVVIQNYERNALQQVDGVGFGMVLINLRVFDGLRKPWFHSPGMGEDIYFCWKAGEHGAEVWVDTRVKTLHTPTFPKHFHDELYYDEQRIKHPDIYEQPDSGNTDLEQLRPTDRDAAIVGAQHGV